MEKIKVVRMITRMNIGGPAIQVSLLSAGLDKERFTSSLITGRVGRHEGDMTYLAGEVGVEPLVIPELHREPDPLMDIISFYKLYRFIKKEKPDIVHTHSSKVGAIGRAAARLAGVPVLVHTIHGHVFHSYFGSFRTNFYLFIERLFAKITDRIVAISSSQKDEILHYLKLKDDGKVTVIPLGFDLARFLHIKEDDGGDGLREELGMAKGEIVVGAVGRLTAIKNRGMFLAAAREIKKNAGAEKIKFLILGEGELQNDLMALADRLGIRQDVVFTGWRKNDEMDQVYRAMDIVTITSLNEGTPVSLIEASASARPIVATDVGGVRDIVRDGKTGFIVASNDVKAFSEAVLSLARDREKRRRFGSCGRDFVKERHSQARLIGDIEDLYDSVLKKKRRIS